MARHNDTGKWGEQLAVETLVGKGYAIVDTNVHIGHYELDIIATKGNRIIFVEVKTRTSEDDDPLEALDGRKISRLCRAANAYVKMYDLPHEVQFDVIAITGSPNSPTAPEIGHYPDSIRPPLRGAR